jgi:UDP-N-acetylglucosamine--N-acetylmuramyl-(pentapeptide) pyrophosphoryl-undecaprenol N-acetylglucosamine transferase
MNSKNIHHIIFTGGGTGGHYFPALAIADALKKLPLDAKNDIEIQCHYIGSRFGIEHNLVKQYNYPFTLVPIKGFSRYKSLRSFVQNLLLPSRILRSWITINKLYRQLKPIATIATGGYVSLLPGLISARKHVPLFLQEQNAYPGMTTKTLAGKSEVIFIAYDEVKKYIKENIDIVNTGNPIRSSIVKQDKKQARESLKLDPKKFTIFIFGGSQGALHINTYIAKRAASWIQKYDLQIIWQTGVSSYEMIKQQYGGHRSVTLLPFIEDMSTAYSASDLIIARAGALSLAEIEKMQIPAILIPLPSAAGNHQYYNAKALEKLGCALIVEEKDFEKSPLLVQLNNLVDNPAKLQNMAESFPERKEDAATKIATYIFTKLSQKEAWS